jgi:hypothetical protein
MSQASPIYFYQPVAIEFLLNQSYVAKYDVIVSDVTVHAREVETTDVPRRNVAPLST